MTIQVPENGLFQQWLTFTNSRSMMECTFFLPQEQELKDLLGDRTAERLTAFGRHASGSLLAFYQEDAPAPPRDAAAPSGDAAASSGNAPALAANAAALRGNADSLPVAWLDSEGSPCLVIGRNLREFLSVLPYGPGWIYTVAAVIENNPDATETDLLERIRARAGANYSQLLETASKRFLDVAILRSWLTERGIAVAADPATLIMAAYRENKGLSSWIINNV